MDKDRRILRERIGRASASSLSASDIENVVHRIAFVLLRFYELVQARAESEGDQVIAAKLNDELKPLIDAIMRFEVRDG